MFHVATVAPFAIVTPRPLEPMILILWPPVVAFSIVKGKFPEGVIRLRVAVRDTLLVTLIYSALVSWTVM